MALATSPQRHLIRTLLRTCELPLDRVTVMHRDLFRASGIAWRDGAELAAELCAISVSQASLLIGQLEART